LGQGEVGERGHLTPDKLASSPIVITGLALDVCVSDLSWWFWELHQIHRLQVRHKRELPQILRIQVRCKQVRLRLDLQATQIMW